MDFFQSKDKSVEEKIDFATKEKLSKKHFSKAHATKGKIHHTVFTGKTNNKYQSIVESAIR